MLTFTFKKKTGKHSIKLYHAGTPLASMFLQWKIDITTRGGFNESTLILKDINNIPAHVLFNEIPSFDETKEMIRVLSANNETTTVWHKDHSSILFIDNTLFEKVFQYITTHWNTKKNDVPILLETIPFEFNKHNYLLLKFNKPIDNILDKTVDVKKLNQNKEPESNLIQLLSNKPDEFFAKVESFKKPSESQIKKINNRRIKEFIEKETKIELELNPDIDKSKITIDTTSVEQLDINKIWQYDKDTLNLLQNYHSELKKLYDQNNDLKSQIDALKDTVIKDSDETGYLTLKIADLEAKLEPNKDNISQVANFLMENEPQILANPSYAINLIYQIMQYNSAHQNWFTTVTNSDTKNQLIMIKEIINLALEN